MNFEINSFIMKKITISIFISLFLTISLSGQTALFSVEDTSFCQGEQIEFTNLRTDFCDYDYVWDFGDGSQDTSRNHTRHIYSQPGNYTATLTMTGDSFLYVLQSITVTNIPSLPWINIPFDLKPDIYFDFEGQNCDRHDFRTNRASTDLDLPHTFNLNREIGNDIFRVEIWDYDFANFDDFIGAFNLDLKQGSGSYVDVSNGFDISWVVQKIPLQPYSVNFTIDPGPTVPLIQSTGPTKVCGLSDVTLFASSDPGIALQWYKNDVPIPNETNDTIVATETGWYRVEAINPGGCSPFSIAEWVVVQPIPTPKIINASTSKPLPIYVCRTSSNIVIGPTLYGGRDKNGGPDYLRSYYDFTWFHNGDTVSNKWDLNKVEEEIVEAPGSYWVVVTDSVGCSGVSDTVHFDVYDEQRAEIFTLDSLSLCTNDTIYLPANESPYLNYEWYRNGVLIPDSLGGNLQKLPVTQGGDYQVIIEDDKPCFQATTSFPVYVSETGVAGPAKPVINLNGNDVFCFGGSATLSINNDPNLSYQWLQNGDTLIGETMNSLAVSSDGNYQIKIQDQQGCVKISDAQNIEVAAPLEIVSTLGKDLMICEGDTTILVAEGDFMDNYRWYYQGNLIDNGPVIMASQSGLYELRASNSLGCPDTIASGTLDYFTIPKLTLDRNLDTLFAGPALEYNWYHADLGVLLSEGSYFIPSKPGPYYVAIVDTNGCENVSDTTRFYLTSVEPEILSLSVKVYPNPTSGFITVQTGSNGSGISRARLFNVSGQEVFAGEIQGMSGKINLSHLPEGTYLLRLEQERYHPQSQRIVVRR